MRFYEEKWDYASAFAAGLAYIALNNSDKVNIFIANGGEIEKCTDLSTKQAFPKAVAFISKEGAGGDTRLNQSVQALSGERLGEGISVIISDFFSEDGYDKAVKLLRSKRQSVNLIQILDVREVHCVERGNVKLIDSETKDSRELELSPEILEKYEKAVTVFRNEMREYCLKNEAGFYSFDSSMPIIGAIGETLK